MAGDHFAVGTTTLLGEPIEPLGRISDLEDGLGSGFTLLRDDYIRNVVEAGEQFGRDTPHYLSPVLRGPVGPLIKGPVGSSDRRRSQFRSGISGNADDLSSSRIGHLERCSGRHPNSIYVAACWHIRAPWWLSVLVEFRGGAGRTTLQGGPTGEQFFRCSL